MLILIQKITITNLSEITIYGTIFINILINYPFRSQTQIPNLTRNHLLSHSP